MTERTRLRLKHISVSGFKGLDDFRLPLATNNTLIIGPNGSGKTSVLQVLDFVNYFAEGSPKHFFSDRNWLVKSVEAFSSRTSAIVIGLFFEHVDSTVQLEWTILWGLNSGDSHFESVRFRHSSSENDAGPQSILRYSRRDKKLTRAGQDPIRGIQLEGSALSILSNISPSEEYPEYFIQEIRNWARGIRSLGLLNPRDMRAGTRGAKTDIGRRGQHIASFLSSLSISKKARLFERVIRFYPAFDDLKTTRKRAGWVDLKLRETYRKGVEIGSDHVSDGFLRLLALASIPEFDEEVSIVLLDEIENGIDPHFVKTIIDEIREETTTQLVATSHSPLLVNFFEPKDIVFIARTKNGNSIAAAFCEIDEIDEDIKYQGPGEIWAHTSDKAITQWVRRAAKRAGAGAPTFATVKPKRSRVRRKRIEQ